MLDGAGGRLLVQARARLGGSAGQPAGIGERLERARALVEHRAVEGGRARARARLVRVQQRHRRPARLLLRQARAQILHPRRRVRAVQRAVVHGVAGDAVCVDEREDLLGPGRQRRVEPFAGLVAEHALDSVRRHPQPGIDQPDIAPGAAEADVGGLQQAHVEPVAGRLQGRRAAGDAAADDHQVGPGLALECGGGERLGRGRAPQIVAFGVGHRWALPGAARRARHSISNDTPWARGSSSE
jgi:hypothetical protein